MIVYEVSADVPAESLDAYARYQRERHIPDVMRTGCFAEASLERIVGDGAGVDETVARFRVRYLARDEETLARYLREHAPALREHFVAHVPEGVRLARAEWRVVERWGG